MVADTKGKKLKTNDEDSPEIDGDLVLSIEKLQQLQDELEKINEKASDEVLEVEKKYNEIRRPVYDKRNEIIQAIPHFWVTAFLSHPALSELVTDEDNQIFKHLTSIEVEDSKDVKSGYSISFNFSPNPYFENKKLTKTFTFHDEGTTKVTATSIDWKEGAGIANGADTENGEKKGNKRPHAEDSFFSWFTEIQPNDDDDIHDEVAEIIKEDLWPNPLTYFNNDADEVEFEGDDDDDDDDDEENDEGDEEGDGVDDD